MEKAEEKEVTMSVKVNPDLWQKARVKVFVEGKTMQALIEDLLSGYLKKTGGLIGGFLLQTMANEHQRRLGLIRRLPKK